MNKLILTAVGIAFHMAICCQPTYSQIVEGFDTVFGMFPADPDEPLAGWRGGLRSQNFGPTGIFPGIDAECGFFDAHSGEPTSYVGMNFSSAMLDAGDTTSTWLMTPEFELSDRTTVSFWTRTIDASMFPDRMVVRLSTNGDSVDVGPGPFDVGDFQDVLVDINPAHAMGGYPEEWTQYEFELNGFGAASGRIAFHYLNEFMNVNGNYIGIDTLAVIPFLLGDVNCDGFINLLDVRPFVTLLSDGGFAEKADLNGDGEVTLEDVDPFVDALTGA